VYAFRCVFCRDTHLSGELWRYPHGTIPWFQKVVRVGGECRQEDDVCTWFAIPIMAPNILFPEQESLDRSWSHAAQEVLVAYSYSYSHYSRRPNYNSFRFSTDVQFSFSTVVYMCVIVGSNAVPLETSSSFPVYFPLKTKFNKLVLSLVELLCFVNSISQ